MKKKRKKYINYYSDQLVSYKVFWAKLYSFFALILLLNNIYFACIWVNSNTSRQFFFLLIIFQKEFLSILDEIKNAYNKVDKKIYN